MRFLMLPLALLFSAAAIAAPTGLLNDTGQDACYDGTNLVACTIANSGDAATYPRQDGRFGRDRAGMAKTGGGAAGFDFTKVCWNGKPEGDADCTGTLVANTTAAATGTPATDWACTKDNHTNLIWSLRIVNITWTNATATGAGSLIKAHNDATRCGFSDGWRVPTRRELLSLVHNGTSSPAIDIAYFPGTPQNTYFWSADSYATNPSVAWSVEFNRGHASANSNFLGSDVRLVRSGP